MPRKKPHTILKNDSVVKGWMEELAELDKNREAKPLAVNHRRISQLLKRFEKLAADYELPPFVQAMLKARETGPESSREEVVGTSTRGTNANLGGTGFVGGCMSPAAAVAGS